MAPVLSQYTSITDLQRALYDGRTSVKEVVLHYLEQIDGLNGQLNAVTAINSNALEEAERLDKLPPEQRGPLHGLPLLIKDQIETAGIPTCFGSKLCKDYIPTKDAAIIQRLKSAGAIILAKTTQPDWAAGWFSTSSLTGTTQHPHDSSRDPGGSSSGCGTGVAAGMGLAAIGGDTCGSIRLPASFCGLVGVRVTPGRISRQGMSALVKTLDTPGPMCGNVEDAARILDVLVGFDESDSFTSINALAPRRGDFPFSDAIVKPILQGRRIGVLRQVFGTHRGIRTLLDDTLHKLSLSGGKLIDVEIPDLDRYTQSTSVYTLRSKADINEFCASREDLAHIKIEDVYHSGEYHECINLTGALVSADFHKNPHYSAKLEEIGDFQRSVAGIYAKHDLDAIIYPTCQVLAPKTKDVLDMEWHSGAFPTNTAIGSYLLFASVSVPIGRAKDDGYPEDPELPVGLEILGVPLSEERILNIAAGIEGVIMQGR
ncbi:uncharacterized protein RCC_01804 [Ramularia collo-cygni]|uniref:Amidase domain-containing protein n=1 Tax=Ramularia collo-cygni TaxID=112498 RepID=A0A2D3V0H2_9PEZI|nr:uncharacterized protein RCC_01804 [Ramularia collo-cygni]CZT15964.1 uncharacterized protein RCC_01804 [Ramularia collo-cygni]